MPAASTPEDVYQAVLELGSEYHEGLKVGCRSLAEEVLRIARRRPLAPCMSDTSGRRLNFLQVMTGAMRATGDNPQMIRALGVPVESMLILGLALSNGLIATSGSLLAQYQGFADVQMGIGMVVWGLASVIIGEALVGHHGLGLLITGAVMGSVVFRLLVAIALRWGLNPNDLKLITAAFVFAALVFPHLLRRRTVPSA